MHENAWNFTYVFLSVFPIDMVHNRKYSLINMVPDTVIRGSTVRPT
ncbi:MAG: hypothetical protein ACTSX6_12950 [Candidatus Heimdallarchaeaceae archaeon]